MILLTAKVFRPKKPSDLWLLQGIGLLQVSLGCVLANDFLFGVLMLAYLASVLWFLALFHLHREAVGPTADRVSRPMPWRTFGLYQTGRWTTVVAAAGILLFLAIPRFGATQWNLLGQLSSNYPEGWPIPTGFSETIDLNRVGVVELNPETALVASATDAAGQPLRRFTGHERWRGVVLDRYYDGRWLSSSAFNRQVERGLAAGGIHVRRWTDAQLLTDRLPPLGPHCYHLTFTLDPQAVGGMVLAEPVVVPPGSTLPPAAVAPDHAGPDLYFLDNDWTLALERFRGLREISYRQVVVTLEEPDLSLPVRFSELSLAQLTTCRGPSLRAWTDQLLRDLAAQSAYHLTPEDLEYAEVGAVQQLRPVHHEKVARALCSYLATSGEYTYSLKLRRHNPRLDPTEDFLRNVRQGHCERYAAGLALMLRTQGIPSRVVKGFRGGEDLGDGQYLIRHSDAHSWVEALVSRPQHDGSVEMHWLTLDPTPGIEAPETSRFSPEWWMEHGQRLGRMAWKDFVIDYDVEQQSTLRGLLRQLLAVPGWRTLVTAASRPGPWLALGPLLLLGFWLGRRYWVRRRPAPHRGPEGVFYARLLAILVRRCRLQPQPAQTPREFGEAARRALQTIAAAAALAEVPVQAAALFYRVRYGRQPLSDRELEAVERQLQELDAALAQP
jgi:hypothetical protein